MNRWQKRRGKKRARSLIKLNYKFQLSGCVDTRISIDGEGRDNEESEKGSGLWIRVMQCCRLFASLCEELFCSVNWSARWPWHSRNSFFSSTSTGKHRWSGNIVAMAFVRKTRQIIFKLEINNTKGNDGVDNGMLEAFKARNLCFCASKAAFISALFYVTRQRLLWE